jgi:hypothetical protein
MEGLGNADSDVDVWVITSDEQADRKVPVFDWRDGFHLNMSSYSVRMVRALAASINALTEEDIQVISTLPANTLDRYYRMAHSRCVQNAEGYRELASLFSLDHVTTVFATWAAVRARIELDKASTCLAAGRSERTLLCARRALEFALDHLLAKSGEAYPSLKWRFEKLARRFGADSELYAEAWLLKAPGDCAPEGYLRDVAGFCANTGVVNYPLVPSHLVHTPGTAVFAIGGRQYLVYAKARLFELNATGLWLWNRIDGRACKATIISEFAEQCGAEREDATQTGRRFLDELMDAGLIVYDTDTLF